MLPTLEVVVKGDLGKHILISEQESSPTSQFKSINSLALSFLYGPTPTSGCFHGAGVMPRDPHIQGKAKPHEILWPPDAKT